MKPLPPSSSGRGRQGSRWRCGGLLVALLLGGALRVPAAEVERIVPDFAALARQAMVTLPPPPAWPKGTNGGTWTVEEIMAEWGKHTDKMPRVDFVQSVFVRPEHEWVVAYASWFNRLLKSLKLSFKAQVFDCDNYAQTFVAFANLIALKGGETRGSICVAWAKVANLRSFGGVESSDLGGHAVVMVGTTKGIFVIEPQSGQMASLQEYPNRDEFAEVHL